MDISDRLAENLIQLSRERDMNQSTWVRLFNEEDFKNISDTDIIIDLEKMYNVLHHVSNQELSEFSVESTIGTLEMLFIKLNRSSWWFHDKRGHAEEETACFTIAHSIAICWCFANYISLRKTTGIRNNIPNTRTEDIEAKKKELAAFSKTMRRKWFLNYDSRQIERFLNNCSKLLVESGEAFFDKALSILDELAAVLCWYSIEKHMLKTHRIVEQIIPIPVLNRNADLFKTCMMEKCRHSGDTSVEHDIRSLAYSLWVPAGTLEKEWVHDKEHEANENELAELLATLSSSSSNKSLSGASKEISIGDISNFEAMRNEQGELTCSALSEFSTSDLKTWYKENEYVPAWTSTDFTPEEKQIVFKTLQEMGILDPEAKTEEDAREMKITHPMFLPTIINTWNYYFSSSVDCDHSFSTRFLIKHNEIVRKKALIFTKIFNTRARLPMILMFMGKWCVQWPVIESETEKDFNIFMCDSFYMAVVAWCVVLIDHYQARDEFNRQLFPAFTEYLDIELWKKIVIGH